ncbi:MAG: tRNA lysidine(34) synthetase TilS [Muribaculaceae bacterium]|nr:tRNA lysidine(34) synthetase TilS [Muribaculaceae bacterium]
MRKIEREVESVLMAARVRSVLVAVSGGADSVALLLACVRISRSAGLHVECVNCNFHLRGEESDRDSLFVADLCSRLGVKLHTLDYDVAGYMKSHPGESIEMACRNLRYADFMRIASESGLDRVAVAHNSDDDIETMLLNMLRGAGVRGMKGMDIDNGHVIRPLLGVTRREIEEYLAETGETFITDSSNLHDDYRRNYLRLEIIPLLENRWPGARKALGKTVTILKEEAGIVENHYRTVSERLCPDTTTLLVGSPDVTTGLILRFIERFGGNSAMAAEIMECVGKDFKERTWLLSDSHKAILERDRLIITDSVEGSGEPEIRWIKMEMNETAMKEVKSNRNHTAIYLPDDSSAYELRRPMTGDRMAPLGMRGTRLVSDIISDARLDRKRKDSVRVLVRKSDAEIIWVTGLKRSRHDLVSSDLRHLWKAELITN